MKKAIRHRRIPDTALSLPDIHPVLARIYSARGIQTTADIDRALKNLAPAPLLKGLAAALDLLTKALLTDQRILVVGDFDADGATSTALMVRALRQFGAKHIDYLVPNRFEYGYGLTPEIVDLALREKKPDLIITVDNGISSIEGVAAAKAAGVRVLITDHHLPGATLPDADAMVNPNQPDCEFPSKHLAGVGVVFYVLSCLRTHLIALDYFNERGIAEPNLANFLDLVALGTVADVVPLDRNNRVLVQQGLLRIRAGRCVPGITALLEVAGKRAANIVATDLSFQVAPRLNAAGRLDDMSHGIESLLTDSPSLAAQYASELDGLNRERRDIEAGMQKEALAALQALKLSPSQLPAALTVFDANWHQGVIGILAGRLKERFHRPVIAFAPASDESGAELKGSARSISGIHIRDALDRVASQHPGLITRFGGHAMAAGLSLPSAHLSAFREAFAKAVAAMADPQDLEPVLYSDGELPPECFSERFAELLREAGPWGQSFPEPVFDGEFLCLDQRILKERYLKLSVCPVGSNRVMDAMAFNVDVTQLPAKMERVRLVYRIDINEFRGARQLQLMVEYLEPIFG